MGPIALVVAASAVFVFTLYIVIVSHDLTALLLGLFIMVIIYAIFRFSRGRPGSGK
jgi:uncharacterized membrane protein YoaK (UPF0700 family)